MIERKIDNDTIMVGRIVKISDLAARKTELQQRQIDSQAERDEYDALSPELQEKCKLPLDFAPEIEEVTSRIDKYTAAKIGEIKDEPPKPIWEIG